MEKMYEKIRDRLIAAEADFRCNNNISDYINANEKEILIDDVESAVQHLLDTLLIDTSNDHNTKDTAKRVAKMFVNEIFGGRYDPLPKVTSFPNFNKYDQLYVTGPISVRSTCAHHFMPIVGKCYIGVFPGHEVIGLSKFNRIVDWIASRPQIQEEMTTEIASQIIEHTKADGCAVLIRANHFCMTHRGVREHESDMTTAYMNGVFREDKSLKQEFYDIVKGMK